MEFIQNSLLFCLLQYILSTVERILGRITENWWKSYNLLREAESPHLWVKKLEDNTRFDVISAFGSGRNVRLTLAV